MPISERQQRAALSVVSPDSRPANSRTYVRSAELALKVLFHGKWQVHILYAMRNGPVRIGQLGRLIPGSSKKVLTQSLRRLEFEGIVVRRDLSDLVLHVEYELHPQIRESIVDLLDRLSQWGADFVRTSNKSDS